MTYRGNMEIIRSHSGKRFPKGFRTGVNALLHLSILEWFFWSFSNSTGQLLLGQVLLLCMTLLCFGSLRTTFEHWPLSLSHSTFSLQLFPFNAAISPEDRQTDRHTHPYFGFLYPSSYNLLPLFHFRVKLEQAVSVHHLRFRGPHPQTHSDPATSLHPHSTAVKFMDKLPCR